MRNKILLLGLASMVFGLFPVAGNVQAKNSLAAKSFKMEKSARVQSWRLGPFATADRAYQVANYARRYGYQANVYVGGCLYCGTREYFVNVWK